MGDLDEHATFEADRAFLTTMGPDATRLRAAIRAYLAAKAEVPHVVITEKLGQPTHVRIEYQDRPLVAGYVHPEPPREKPEEVVPTLEWALDYARTYWQWGTEPQVQAALTVLAQHIAKEPEEHYDRYAHRDGWCVPVLRTGVDDA